MTSKDTLFGRPRDFLSRSRFVPSVLGVVLLVAALMKGYEVANQDFTGATLVGSRPFLILLVLFELALGQWVLGGLYPRETSWLILVTFIAFFQAALYFALSKEPSCHCLGLFGVPPWLAVAFDIFAIAAIMFWQPVGEGATLVANGRRAIVLGLVFLVTAVPAVTSMIQYAPMGQMATLRNDPQLSHHVAIEKSKATVSDVLNQLHAATACNSRLIYN
ncbi:MAG: hypothetical protein NZM42_13555 [Gemmatales bacterium]|nr:hypothetical protein [Gemmatales bacterium]